MQSKLTFSCSLPGRRSISIAKVSMARSSCPPRSSTKGESGPESSTKISGRSQSRSWVIGGSTVIRYLRWRPPWVTTPRRSASIFLAAAILSGMGMIELSASLVFLSCSLRRHLAHFTPQAGTVHDGLLCDGDQITFCPVKTQAGSKIPTEEPHHDRHHHVHHFLLGRIHSRLRRHALCNQHSDEDADRQDMHRIG